MLYELDGDTQWLNAAAKALGYLVRSRAGRTSVEADHWALLATAKLQPRYDSTDQSVPLDALHEHTAQICESMLAERRRQQHELHSLLHGCFTDDGRTTPTATRLEGLLAAWEIVPSHERDLRARMLSASSEGIAFLLRARVASGEYAGAIPRAIRILPPGHPRNTGSFNRLATEVRIDYVQHALSAMLAYDRVAYEQRTR
jgi:hypothetical protein